MSSRESGPLSYEELLVELQALLGRRVSIEITLRLAQRPRPLALLVGKLTHGRDVDLSRLEGVPSPTPWLAGESVLFFVDNSLFVVREADFKHGLKDDDGNLGYDVGRVRMAIMPWPA